MFDNSEAPHTRQRIKMKTQAAIDVAITVKP